MGLFDFFGRIIGASGLNSPQSSNPYAGLGLPTGYGGGSPSPLGRAVQDLATVGLVTSLISNGGNTPTARPGGFFDTLGRIYQIDSALALGANALRNLSAFGGSLFGNGGSFPSPWGTGQPPLLPDYGAYLRTPYTGTSSYGPSGEEVPPVVGPNFSGVAGQTSVDLSNVAPALRRPAFYGLTLAVDGLKGWFERQGYSGGFGIPSASVNHSGVVSLTVQQGPNWQQVITIEPGLTREQLFSSIDQQFRNNPRRNPAGLQVAQQPTPPYGSMEGGVQSSAPNVSPGVGPTWSSYTMPGDGVAYQPPANRGSPQVGGSYTTTGGNTALSQYFRQTAGLLPSANQPA